LNNELQKILTEAFAVKFKKPSRHSPVKPEGARGIGTSTGIKRVQRYEYYAYQTSATIGVIFDH
jgi:hypothetical protein